MSKEGEEKEGTRELPERWSAQQNHPRSPVEAGPNPLLTNGLKKYTLLFA